VYVWCTAEFSASTQNIVTFFYGSQSIQANGKALYQIRSRMFWYHIISSSLFTNYHNVWCQVVWATGSARQTYVSVDFPVKVPCCNEWQNRRGMNTVLQLSKNVQVCCYCHVSSTLTSHTANSRVGNRSKHMLWSMHHYCVQIGISMETYINYIATMPSTKVTCNLAGVCE
jgi:hypothetical protein